MRYTLNNLNFPYGQKVTDLENAFTVHEDSKHNLVFNLNETIYLNIAKSSLKRFIPDHPMHWSLISYKLYGTTRLAWILMKTNGVRANRIFSRVLPTQVVYYLDKGKVQEILSSIERS